MKYGTKTRTSYAKATGRKQSVIGEVSETMSGNVVLRVGREVGDESHQAGWEQTEHVVLEADEAISLAVEIIAAAQKGTRRAALETLTKSLAVEGV